MAEKSFDALVRQALLDAAWQEYGAAWEAAEEPDFSPEYLRWRTRLLADPFAWMKKRMRPLWLKILRTAACLVLACAVVLGSLMAVSPSVRAAVLYWLREISGNLMTYSADARAQADALPSNWHITWLPEGWELRDMTRNTWKYAGPAGQGSLTYACYVPEDAELITNVDDTEDAGSARETVQVQGYRGDYYESGKYRVLLWENEAGYLFMLRTSTAMEKDVFLKIAESVEFYAGPGIAYEMGWVPPEYEPLYRDELIGAAQEVWTFSETSLTWRYITDPLCPFALPDGVPEEVTVGDLTGQYWAAEEAFEPSEPAKTTVNGEPVENSGSTIEVGGVTISISGSPEDDQTGTLVWTDPDTDTVFFLEGALDRSDLMRMAESVVQTAPDPSSPSHGAMVLEGTAGAD